jgi:predicted RNase H-like HicB family nuclease
MLFPIAIEVGDDSTSFGVVVPDIAGCFSAGNDVDEAVINAREAIELHLELLSDDNQSIPTAKSIKHYMNDKKFSGWAWAIVDIDITPYLGKSQKVNVTLPESLIKKIDDRVAREPSYKTRSGFLAKAAIHELGNAG